MPPNGERREALGLPGLPSGRHQDTLLAHMVAQDGFRPNRAYGGGGGGCGEYPREKGQGPEESIELFSAL